MKLEEAIKSIENDIEVSCWATDIVIEELRRLQKENEELKNIDLTTVHIKGVCDEKERWRNKIREKIEEIKSRMNDDCLALHEFQREAKIDILQDLLKEE